MKKAIVLLSGGLDSAVTLALALACKREVYPLAFDYGQRNKKELRSASQIVSHYSKLRQPIRSLKLVGMTGLDFDTSALTSALDVPKIEDIDGSSPGATYVPARNSIFLAIGASFAEALEASEVWVGFNDAGPVNPPDPTTTMGRLRALAGPDHTRYPDCSPEFVTAFQGALAVGTLCGAQGRPISLMAPLVRMTKQAIVEEGVRLEAPLGVTWSCYTAENRPCGDCSACFIRRLAFDAANLADPAL